MKTFCLICGNFPQIIPRHRKRRAWKKLKRFFSPRKTRPLPIQLHLLPSQPRKKAKNRIFRAWILDFRKIHWENRRQTRLDPRIVQQRNWKHWKTQRNRLQTNTIILKFHKNPKRSWAKHYPTKREYYWRGHGPNTMIILLL